MSRLRTRIAAAGLLAALAMTLPASAQPQIDNDYPTVAIADYVLGCMVANGQTRQALERCACSIDVISTLITYDQYVKAETVLSAGQVTGQSSEFFRGTAQLRDMVDILRRAQAEAEVQCF